MRKEKLEHALQQARRLIPAEGTQLAPANPGAASRDTIAVMVGAELRMVPLQDVRFFRADQKYVTLYHAAGESVIDESLKRLAEELSPNFFRINRGILVALSAIEALERDEQGRPLVRVRETGEMLPVSRRRLADLRRALLARESI